MVFNVSPGFKPISSLAKEKNDFIPPLWAARSDREFEKRNKEEFASREYFELFRTHPESAQFLALGQNVRFVLKDRLYEIYE